MFPKILLSAISIICFTAVNAQTQDSTLYPAVVKFQSECCGVPDDRPLRKAIESFKKKYKVKKISAVHIGPMGREGEYYLAFSLKELKVKQSACLIEKMTLATEKMKDKGSAVLEENMKVNLSGLPRVRVSEVIF